MCANTYTPAFKYIVFKLLLEHWNTYVLRRGILECTKKEQAYVEHYKVQIIGIFSICTHVCSELELTEYISCYYDIPDTKLQDGRIIRKEEKRKKQSLITGAKYQRCTDGMVPTKRVYNHVWIALAPLS